MKEEPPPLLLSKWFRRTEFGMNPDAYKATMVNNETRVRFTPSPFGWVIGHWLNIDIKLDQDQDLMR